MNKLISFFRKEKIINKLISFFKDSTGNIGISFNENNSSSIDINHLLFLRSDPVFTKPTYFDSFPLDFIFDRINEIFRYNGYSLHIRYDKKSCTEDAICGKYRVTYLRIYPFVDNLVGDAPPVEHSPFFDVSIPLFTVRECDELIEGWRIFEFLSLLSDAIQELYKEILKYRGAMIAPIQNIKTPIVPVEGSINERMRVFVQKENERLFKFYKDVTDLTIAYGKEQIKLTTGNV